MTVKVAGCWELGWNVPLSEFDLWHFPLREYQVDEFIMTPVSGIKARVKEFQDIPEALAANPELTPVYVDENGEDTLGEFEHPENAIYILGKANYSPLRTAKGLSVKIKTPDNGGRIWQHQAIVLVLQDRYDRHSRRH